MKESAENEWVTGQITLAIDGNPIEYEDDRSGKSR